MAESESQVLFNSLGLHFDAASFNRSELLPWYMARSRPAMLFYQSLIAPQPSARFGAKALRVLLVHIDRRKVSYVCTCLVIFVFDQALSRTRSKPSPSIDVPRAVPDDSRHFIYQSFTTINEFRCPVLYPYSVLDSFTMMSDSPPLWFHPLITSIRSLTQSFIS